MIQFYMYSIMIYIMFTATYIGVNWNMSFLNPIHNYKKWLSFNWFGVIICTLLINIIFLPYAILYWLYKLIYFLFTVGRK